MGKAPTPEEMREVARISRCHPSLAVNRRGSYSPVAQKQLVVRSEALDVAVAYAEHVELVAWSLLHGWEVTATFTVDDADNPYNGNRLIGHWRLPYHFSPTGADLSVEIDWDAPSPPPVPDKARQLMSRFRRWHARAVAIRATALESPA